MSKSVGFWNIRSTRLYMTLVFGLAVLANSLIRGSLSMAVVCMVNGTAVAQLRANTSTGRHRILNVDNTSCQSISSSVEVDYDGPFVWTHSEQGFMFSALFIGGLISILPSGWLADRYNPKRLVIVGLLLSSVLSFLIPVTAYHLGYKGLFGLRFIMGFFGQAIIVTGISSISARWVPPNERSTVLAMYTAGNQIAMIIGMPMNAFLCSSKHFMGGWPSIFYVNGLIGVVALIIWAALISNRPEASRFISQSELTYITKSLSDQNLGKRKDVMKNVPWRKILTSPVVITCFIGNFGGGFMVTFMIVYLPTYFKEALLLDLKSNGFFSALPYIVMTVSKMAFAIVADRLKKTTHISHTTIAKLFNSFGNFGVSIFLVACAFMDCNHPILAVTFLSLGNGFLSGVVPGWATCLVSIAPVYTGIINSMGRFAGQIGAVLAPFVVSLITVEGTAEEWRIVFIVNAVLVSVGAVLFIIFGSAEIQEWAKAAPASVDDEQEQDKSLFPANNKTQIT